MLQDAELGAKRKRLDESKWEQPYLIKKRREERAQNLLNLKLRKRCGMELDEFNRFGPVTASLPDTATPLERWTDIFTDFLVLSEILLDYKRHLNFK